MLKIRLRIFPSVEDYYRKRVLEYEEVYHRDDPRRKAELDRISTALQQRLAGKDVLEVACGTGYWTQILSSTARSITATDIADEMLEIARKKTYACPVHVQLADAYAISSLDMHAFSGGLANFWLSHLQRAKVDAFLEGFHGRLREGSIAFMADNVYVPGVGGELVKKHGEEDTYKVRELSDGTKHLVLKNYYSKGELVGMLERNGAKVSDEGVFFGECYWFLSYEI